MASLCKKGQMWYVRLRDETGRERSIKAGPDKSVANQMKRDLESKVQRIKAGVLDPREADALDAERVPIAQHVSEYIGNLESQGGVCSPCRERQEAARLVPGRDEDHPTVSTVPRWRTPP
jgi:hypothetical protein